jgi:Tol biopolymer transport system component
VFVARSGEASRLVFVRPDGSGERRVDAGDGAARSPAWSPDSTRVAFARERDGDSDLLVIGRDGSGLRGLTDGPGVDANPEWFRFDDGANGENLVTFDRLAPGSDDYGVAVVDPEGGAVRQLSASDALDVDPAWSPDGDRIAFATGRDGNLEIYAMAGDGSAQTRLTIASRNDTEPAYERPPTPVPPLPPPPAPTGGGGGGCEGGGAGNNRYVGTNGRDRICGGGGNDRIRGLDGRDILYGDTGRDRLRGGPGRDYLDVRDGAGGDVLRGGPGRDTGVWDPNDRVRSVKRQR